MPYNDNGSYSRYQGSDRCKNDRDANIDILASKMDDEFNDIAGAISEALPADGRKPISGPIKMSGYPIKNLGPATQSADAPTVAQVQTNAFNDVEDVSTEANTIKVYLKPALTSQPRSLFLTIQPANTNTGPTSIIVNTLSAKPILYGTAEIPEGALVAGQIYYIAYNRTLDSYQLLLSGSCTVPGSLPLLTTIMPDALLVGEEANGWLLQGSKGYMTKYNAAYTKLANEYNSALSAVETICSKEFSFKVNPATKRRFYTMDDYTARFELCGDSGGHVVDTDDKFFLLRKNNNFDRPTTDFNQLGVYCQDQISNIKAKAAPFPGQIIPECEGAFKVEECAGVQGGLEDWAKSYRLVLDASAVVNTGDEVQPRSTLKPLYYRVEMPASNGIKETNAIKEVAAELAILKTELKELKVALDCKLSAEDVIAGENITIETLIKEKEK